MSIVPYLKRYQDGNEKSTKQQENFNLKYQKWILIIFEMAFDEVYIVIENVNFN